MRATDPTPEEREILAGLYAAMVAKIRYSEPPPEKAHLYELCFEDRTLPGGMTIYGIPCWFPIEETQAWEEFRWARRWNQFGRVGHA